MSCSYMVYELQKLKDKRAPEKKSYREGRRLTQYMEKKLQHLKQKEAIDEKKRAGEDITKLKKAFDRKYKNLGTQKTRLLDSVIFRSMANLIVFFEYLVKYPELRDGFEDDIKELFGYIKGPWYETDKFKEEPGKTYGITTRLINSLLTWDWEKDPNNFRLNIIADLQKILSRQITSLAFQDLNLSVSQVNSIVNSDMARAEAWTKLYASRYTKSKEAEIDRTEVPHRPVSF